jgi:hypothetical protein
MWTGIKKIGRSVSAVYSVAERVWQALVLVLGLSAAAVLAWLTRTWGWYWATFSWAGTAIAFLIAFIILGMGTLMFSAAASMYARRHVKSDDVLPEADGPLVWFHQLTLEHNQAALHIHGKNNGTRAVKMVEARIVSAMSGEEIKLEIVASGNDRMLKIVKIDEINAIPPGAPIELVAIFGDRSYPGLPKDEMAISVLAT